VKTVNDFLLTLEDPYKKLKFEELFIWVKENFPDLELVIKWNQPMYINNGTFIIAFSAAKFHMSFAPEASTILHFNEDIEDAGYVSSKELVRIKWDDKINYDLLYRIIEYNINDKLNCKTFFRKYK